MSGLLHYIVDSLPRKGQIMGPRGAGQKKVPLKKVRLGEEGVESKRASLGASLSGAFSQDSLYPWPHFPSSVFLKSLPLSFLFSSLHVLLTLCFTALTCFSHSRRAL